MVDLKSTVSERKNFRLAVIGCGFWSRFQISAWKELSGVEIVGVWNRTRSRAEILASQMSIPYVAESPESLIQTCRPDAVDIVTDVGTHAQFVRLSVNNRIPVICQKPMTTSLSEANDIVSYAASHHVPFYVHENWRWQKPIRALKKEIDSGVIGRIFRARIDFVTGFPVFDNQPFLRTLPQFILTDMGSHILDVARFLFGEPASVYCCVTQIHAEIAGEDVATVVLAYENGTTVTCNLSYAGNAYEHDRFPETYILAEGSRGAIQLAPDYWLRITTSEGTFSRRIPPPRYTWADPQYDVVHASIVDCNKNLLAALRGENEAETSAADNLKTVKLVFAAYESAATRRVVELRASDHTEKGDGNG